MLFALPHITPHTNDLTHSLTHSGWLFFPVIQQKWDVQIMQVRCVWHWDIWPIWIFWSFSSPMVWISFPPTGGHGQWKSDQERRRREAGQGEHHGPLWSKSCIDAKNRYVQHLQLRQYVDPNFNLGLSTQYSKLTIQSLPKLNVIDLFSSPRSILFLSWRQVPRLGWTLIWLSLQWQSKWQHRYSLTTPTLASWNYSMWTIKKCLPHFFCAHPAIPSSIHPSFFPFCRELKHRAVHGQQPNEPKFQIHEYIESQKEKSGCCSYFWCRYLFLSPLTLYSPDLHQLCQVQPRGVKRWHLSSTQQGTYREGSTSTNQLRMSVGELALRFCIYLLHKYRNVIETFSPFYKGELFQDEHISPRIHDTVL